ncbi:16S rRNA (cytidine(1402)-2'-O)-methyltransferase [Pleurocapsa sp. CCALA 161]|uniref:16S rRNA (cytidine(1402)-2'-O)-methyltransferase n=1 Tax=Pleurocapsa sp. CCALA 161 TaxID=2107688 RepID=UPI000D04B898|nr:16S rRNA (cytidine(1402)-2'-O)-methyltransferase [Pleurocapsa sp. CCALA 161]PSB11998.1 16S rRNA (cytidine(1402)-2'-O)-methyltransferase [Pleurocapsa sp. CCALA 161]
MGKLYLVGTPIGNLEDITLRAIRILQSVDLIAAEDTRRTGKLLQHLAISTPQISYNEHNHHSRIQELINRLQQGTNLALVTDAGMPSISDPGVELVQAAIAHQITVIPIPGPTAVISALAASGLPTDRFIFEGFLPLKQSDRQVRLELLRNETKTIVLYEAPHRILKTLKDLVAVVGDTRKIVLARELTKIHEEFWRGNIGEAIDLYSNERQPKGEYTLVIKGADETSLITSKAELKHELQQLLAQGMTRSQASRQLAKLTSLSRREIYQLEIDNDNLES